MSVTTNDAKSTKEEGYRSKPSHDTTHPLYVIYGRWSFEQINGFLSQYTDKPHNDIGTLKTDYDSDGRDTGRTFVFLTDTIVNNLVKDGFNKSSKEGNRSGFSFSKFRVRDDFHLVNKSLCIPIPRNLNLPGKRVKEIIYSKLDECLTFDIVEKEKVTVTVNLFDRENDTPGSNAFVTFDPETSDETIAVVKAVIHGTYWEERDFIFNCHYARNSNRSGAQGAQGAQGTEGQGSQGKREKTFYKQKYTPKVEGNET